jgi:prepilin-type N-terminal cleavage/methylation domain-containing protein
MNSHLHKTTISDRRHFGRGAFTLVELMVSVSILVILMLVVSSFVNLVQRTWVRTNSNISQFREARLAFDAMTRTINQSTLNTYWQSGQSELRQQGTMGTIFVGSQSYSLAAVLQLEVLRRYFRLAQLPIIQAMGCFSKHL